ncbi:hypothetical protein LBO01_18470 [Companilactobacillus paralimentarius]|nr:hypothetical protein LBO01_18470 [Companilactobacillus paralimentarius]
MFPSSILITGGVANEFFASNPSLIIGVNFGISFHCILDLSDNITIDRGNKALDTKKGQTLGMSDLNSI